MVMPFRYPLSDVLSPQGNNSLSSLALFYQRSLYRDRVYPGDYPTDLDTWYAKSLYGRVDNIQNTIVFDAQYLKPIVSAKNKRVYAADFVVTGFERFAEHMKRATINGRLSAGGNEDLRNLMASEGWVCPERSYDTYIANLYEGMVRYYMPTHNNKVKNFETFVPVFKSFVKDSARIMPVTLTNFLLSSVVSPQVSGIVVKIGNYDCGDDREKFRNFISDPNYPFYRRAAKKFGFIVNENAPWILTADLFSEAMIQNLGAYYTSAGIRVDKSSFFGHYYVLACINDTKNLKHMFVNFYNKYIDANPFYQEESIADPRCPHKTMISQPIKRNPDASYEKLQLAMNDMDWVDFYVDLRSVEHGEILLNKSYMMRTARSFYDVKPIAGLSGLANAVSYVNSIYKGYVYPRSFGSIIKNIKPLQWKEHDGRITYSSYAHGLVDEE
tara:strand:- start:762 stop:2084 length:1323 start_codon:yes stop_codon:yes gene_type:complete